MQQFGQFVSDHWMLWLAFFVVLILTLINELWVKKQKAKELSPQAAIALMNGEDAVVIDLRDKEAFKRGHIIDSINVKADDLTPEKLKAHQQKHIIFVCERGVQSATLAAKMRSQEMQPMILGGGISSWQQADLPLVKKG